MHFCICDYNPQLVGCFASCECTRLATHPVEQGIVTFAILLVDSMQVYQFCKVWVFGGGRGGERQEWGGGGDKGHMSSLLTRGGWWEEGRQGHLQPAVSLVCMKL